MVEYAKEVYLKKKGWYGFKILRDGTPIIIQEFKPEVEGFQPMGEKFANKLADRLLKYFQRLEACETPEEANQAALEEVKGYTPITEE